MVKATFALQQYRVVSFMALYAVSLFALGMLVSWHEHQLSLIRGGFFGSGLLIVGITALSRLCRKPQRYYQEIQRQALAAGAIGRLAPMQPTTGILPTLPITLELRERLWRIIGWIAAIECTILLLMGLWSFAATHLPLSKRLGRWSHPIIRNQLICLVCSDDKSCTIRPTH